MYKFCRVLVLREFARLAQGQSVYFHSARGRCTGVDNDPIIEFCFDNVISDLCFATVRASFTTKKLCVLSRVNVHEVHFGTSPVRDVLFIFPAFLSKVDTRRYFIFYVLLVYPRQVVGSIPSKSPRRSSDCMSCISLYCRITSNFWVFFTS